MLFGPSTGVAPPKPPWARRWGTVSDWADKLLRGDTKLIPLAAVDRQDPERPESLLLLLNAAWLARIRPDPADDAEPDLVEEISQRAAKLMLNYVRNPAPSPASGPTNF